MSNDHESTAAERPLRQCWEMFDRQCLPQAMGDLQRGLARRAFYAGADSVLTIVEHLRELPPAEFAEVLQQLRAEADVFRATVGTTVEGRV